MKIRFSWKKLTLWLVGIFLVCGLAGGGGAALLLYWASRDLPNITRIADYNPPQATTVLARDGSVLGTLYHEKRFVIGLKDMSRFLPMAFLAAEDDSFYRHMGVDPVAIARAAINNFRKGRAGEGGSTITQQLIKQLLLTSERSYTRKMKEAILAYRLEKDLSKDEILTIYLNQIYLGEHAYGVEARRAHLFRQARFGHHPGRKRGHRRSAQGPQQLQSLSPSRGRQGPPDVRAGPPARPEMDHPPRIRTGRGRAPGLLEHARKARAGPPSGTWRKPAVCSSNFSPSITSRPWEWTPASTARTTSMKRALPCARPWCPPSRLPRAMPCGAAWRNWTSARAGAAPWNSWMPKSSTPFWKPAPLRPWIWRASPGSRPWSPPWTPRKPA